MRSEEVYSEKGEVIAVNGEKAKVKINTKEGCRRCRTCASLSPTERVIDALITKPVQVGDRVSLSFEPGMVVKSALILYLLPLVAFFIGYYIGTLLINTFSFLPDEEIVAALFAFAFLLASFFPIYLYDKRKAKDKRFIVTIQN